jgi:hypothetical protein
MEKVNLEQPTKDAEEKARKEKEFKDQYETLIRPPLAEVPVSQAEGEPYHRDWRCRQT